MRETVSDKIRPLNLQVDTLVDSRRPSPPRPHSHSPPLPRSLSTNAHVILQPPTRPPRPHDDVALCDALHSSSPSLFAHQPSSVTTHEPVHLPRYPLPKENPRYRRAPNTDTSMAQIKKIPNFKFMPSNFLVHHTTAKDHKEEENPTLGSSPSRPAGKGMGQPAQHKPQPTTPQNVKPRSETKPPSGAGEQQHFHHMCSL